MNSIRLQLIVWLIVPLTFVATFVAAETYFSSRKVSNELHDRTLLAVTMTIAEHVVANDGDLLAENVLEALTESLGDQFFYHVVGPDNVFATGYSNRPNIPDNMILESGRPQFFDAVHQGDKVRVAAMRQLIVQSKLNGWTTITTWQRVKQREILAYSLFGRSLLRLLVVTLFAGIIVWFAVTRGLRPIESLRTAIDKRTPFDLTPIKRPMPQELQGIVSAMNDLLARVARSKANRERFVGDAAHQLRNPIAALKTQAENALQSKQQDQLRSGLANIVNTTNQTGRMVEQMLASARANALEFDSGEVFDLNEIVVEAARASAPIALLKKQDFAFDAHTHPVMVKGNKILVQEATLNLIDNAVRHSPEKASVSIAIVIEEIHARICVTDTGISMSQEDLLRLSQPFATGDDRASGSGLGLSITKDIAIAHGGYLKSTALEDGRGKTICFTLPLANTKTV
ncbi:MAG: sensor histidine kinase [Pseudomonadota bacterium]